MTEEEKKCRKCGEINKKSDVNCVNCGASLDILENFSTDQGKINDIPKTGHYRQLHYGFKVALYFGIVVVVDLVLSLILILSLGLPLESYFFLFLGFFFLIMIIVGIIGGITVKSDFTAHLAKAIGRMIAAIIVISIILIPIYILIALPSILGSMSITFSLSPQISAIIEAINSAIVGAFEAIVNALIFDPISQIFSAIGDSIEESFSNVEVPGFEPFLLITIFLIASIIIIYRYHLTTRKL